jgi:hypothetical protein
MSKKPDGSKGHGGHRASYEHNPDYGFHQLSKGGRRERKRSVEFERVLDARANCRKAIREANEHIAAGNRNLTVRLLNKPKPRVSHFKNFYQQAKQTRLNGARL